MTWAVVFNRGHLDIRAFAHGELRRTQKRQPEGFSKSANGESRISDILLLLPSFEIGGYCDAL